MTIQKLISFARAFQTFGPSLELQQNLSSQLWSPMPSLAQWQCWSLSRAKFEFWWSTLQKDGPIVWLLLQNHLLGCSYLKKKSNMMSISRTLNNNLHRRHFTMLSLLHVILPRQEDEACWPLRGSPSSHRRFFFWIHWNLNHSQESRCGAPSSKQPSKSPSTSQQIWPFEYQAANQTCHVNYLHGRRKFK